MRPRSKRVMTCCASMLVLASGLACDGRSPQAPTPVPNAAPTASVVIQGASSCTPGPGAPCVLDVLAQASDPDGDPLTYEWSGCANGTAARATCTVQSPGPVVASVQVSDGRGHAVTATATGEGLAAPNVNYPPSVRIGYTTLRSPTLIEVLGNVWDPDEGLLCGAQHCVSATTSGACSISKFSCTCLAELELDIVRSATSGACGVTLTLKDRSGQLGTPILDFDLANPGVPTIR